MINYVGLGDTPDYMGRWFYQIVGVLPNVRQVSFPSFESVFEARAALPALRAENPELTHWGIVEFSTWFHLKLIEGDQ